MTKVPVGKIAISGAGGWLGTELLELLLVEWGWNAVRENVICIGSYQREIRLSNGLSLNVLTFEQAHFIGVLDGFVHLAFQTRDKVHKLGHAAYVEANMGITSNALKLIQRSSPKWVATVSSGAVLESPQSAKLEKDIASNPYGFLKNVEETMLRALCCDTGINLSIGRLWGAGGAYMPLNPAYALSDFISGALVNNTINIKSARAVHRRYCDASTFMRVLLLAGVNSRETVFNSGGEAVELAELAQLISSKTGASVSRGAFDSRLPPDSYFPTDASFSDLCEKYGVKETSLEHLVSATVSGHESQLGARVS